MTDESSAAPLDELVAVMAHDINNPLAALVTNLSFLEGAIAPVASTDASEALADAQMLCDMLRRLVGNLDLLARRETPISREAAAGGARPFGGATGVDLALIARDAVGRMSKQAASSDVELVLDPAVRVGEAIARSEREGFSRAADNVIAFAIERAPAHTRVTVMVESVEGEGRLVVRYTPRPERGGSVASAPLDRVGRRRKIQSSYGRGLALYCAQLTLGLFGGRLEEKREADGQTRLTLIAPRVEER